MKKRIYVLLIVLVIVGIATTIPEYRVNHLYYRDMLGDKTNIGLILVAVCASAIPLAYIYLSKSIRVSKVAIYMGLGAIVHALSTFLIKDGSIAGTGLIMTIINFSLMRILIIFMSNSFLVIGNYIYRSVFGKNTNNLVQSVMALGFGFSAFTLLLFVLVYVGLLYSIVSWLLLLVLIYINYTYSQTISHIYDQIKNIFTRFYYKNKLTGGDKFILILMLLTVMYIYYGLVMSYIPYPTARDANHAYMYIPTVFANHNGAIWNHNFGGQFFPNFYLSYIGYFFSLMLPLKNWGFWIAPDSVAVVMNYTMAIYSIFGLLGLTQLAIEWVSDRSNADDDIDNTILYQYQQGLFGLSWMTILLWMTSGMGAFLVFIDNKSDFGIMFLSLMALLAGILGIWHYGMDTETQSDDLVAHTTVWNIADKYLIMSGALYALSIISKQTGVFDAVSFFLFATIFAMGKRVTIGIGLIFLAILAILNISEANRFVGVNMGYILLVLGIISAIIGFMLSPNIRSDISNFVAKMRKRGVSMVLVILVLKGPYIIYGNMQYPPEGGVSATTIVKQIFLIHNSNEKSNESNGGKDDHKNMQYKLIANNKSDNNAYIYAPNKLFLAQNSNKKIDNTKVCSRTSAGISSTGDLYTGLRKADGSAFNEDLGRYVGFAQKDFENSFLRSIVPNDTCLTMDTLANILCKDQSIVQNPNISKLKGIMNDLASGDVGYILLSGIVNNPRAATDGNAYLREVTSLLDNYRRTSTIYDDGSKLGVPYKGLLARNVVFNWSLQNHSSYYTDIGAYWLFMFFVIVVGAIYGFWTRNRMLSYTTMVAIFGRAYRWIVGSAIIRYAMGLISWTVIVFVLFVYDLLIQEKNSKNKELTKILTGLIVLVGVGQLFLNFIRISAQNYPGPFMQYKFAQGNIQKISDNGSIDTPKKIPLVAKDIFDMQFPQYNPILTELNSGHKDYNIMIAGTYLQYFITQQNNILPDGFLDGYYKDQSDGDLCKTHLRLKDKNLKYLIVDPNIASVVMGGGNSSLMDKFFAKLDPMNGKILQDGAFISFARMTSAGYMGLRYSNNLGAKYAFGLPDEYLSNKLNISDKEKLIKTKAQMATARFWPSESATLSNAIANIFVERLSSKDGLQDIADIFGKVIDIDRTYAVAQNPNNISSLNQDERFALVQYLSLIQTSKSNPQQFQQAVGGIIQQSLGGGTQLIILEVK